MTCIINIKSPLPYISIYGHIPNHSGSTYILAVTNLKPQEFIKVEIKYVTRKQKLGL